MGYLDEEELEKALRIVYKRADNEVQAKAKDYFDSFAKKDAEMIGKLQNHEISAVEYSSWRKKKMLQGDRYNNLIETIGKEYSTADKRANDIINFRTPKAYIGNFNSMARAIDGQVYSNSFNLIDEGAVKTLIKEDGNILVATDKSKKYVQKRGNKVRAELLQGIVQGESPDKVAKRLQKVTDSEYKTAVRDARTMMNSARNSGNLDAMIEAEKKGILLKKMWKATHDSRTRDSHTYLDGELKKPLEDFSNGLLFPCDPHGSPAEVYNCRCRMVEVVEGFTNMETGEVFISEGYDADEYKKKAEAYWQAQEAKKQAMRKSTKSTVPTLSAINQDTQDLIHEIENNGVAINPVAVRDYDLTEDEIILEISGGDLTKGSCASVGLAYAGQKCGYDVYDFRDGESRKWYSRKDNKTKMWNAVGVTPTRIDKFKSSVANGKLAMKQLEVGKQYYLGVGRHATIVKAEEEAGKRVYYYLELQDPYQNGWKKFNDDTGVTLVKRFRCSTENWGANSRAELVEISQLEGNENFKAVLGGINTKPTEQRRGGNGQIR